MSWHTFLRTWGASTMSSQFTGTSTYDILHKIWFMKQFLYYWKSLSQTFALCYHCSFRSLNCFQITFLGSFRKWQGFLKWLISKGKKKEQAPSWRYTICELKRRVSSQHRGLSDWMMAVRLLFPKRGQELHSLYSLEANPACSSTQAVATAVQGQGWAGQAGHWAGPQPAAKPISLADFSVSAQWTILETDASKSRSTWTFWTNPPMHTGVRKERASCSRLRTTKAVLDGADLPSDRHEERYFLHSSPP